MEVLQLFIESGACASPHHSLQPAGELTLLSVILCN